MQHQFMLHKNKFKCRTASLLFVNMNRDDFVKKVRIVTVLSIWKLTCLVASSA